jgi:hypothetical protein
LRKKLLALRQVVQVDFQRKRIFFMGESPESEKHGRIAAATLSQPYDERARRAISETGTGFAYAKLSEALPPLALLGSSG